MCTILLLEQEANLGLYQALLLCTHTDGTKNAIPSSPPSRLQVGRCHLGGGWLSWLFTTFGRAPFNWKDSSTRRCRRCFTPTGGWKRVSISIPRVSFLFPSFTPLLSSKSFYRHTSLSYPIVSSTLATLTHRFTFYVFFFQQHSAQPAPVVPQGPYRNVFDITYHNRDARRRLKRETVSIDDAKTAGLPPIPGTPVKSTFLGMMGDFDRQE